jgi:ribonuclease HI
VPAWRSTPTRSTSATGILQWLAQWKARDWRTADRKPVKNVDLWQELEREIERHEIDWHWVRGHSGHEGNEHADRLANRASTSCSPPARNDVVSGRVASSLH